MSFSTKCLDVNILDKNQTFLDKKMKLFQSKIDKITHIQAKVKLLMDKYARKRIHNNCLVWTKNSDTRDNCLASLGKHFDADQLPSRQNFQSTPHNH